MAVMWRIACPNCKKDFIVDDQLYEMDVELLCPYCDHYFKKAQSPFYVQPPANMVSSQDVVNTAKYKIYKPKG